MNYIPTEWKTGDIVSSQRLNKMEEGIANAGGTQMLSVTHAELLAMCNAGTLTPGMQYRITDYVCTTTQAESQAVSHPFDIIVVADSASVLNENARACLHDGDDYYSAQDHQANLEAWQLKYCIDNDDNRFAWADTVNGKGVIYYMKDDRNNECPYDFKQIQFKRYPITECVKVPSLVGKYAALSYSEGITGIDEQNPVWCYTFSVCDQEDTSVIYDGSIVPLSDDESGHGCFVLNNKISPLINYKDLEEGYGQKILYLNDIVFTGHWGNNCQSNTFDDNCSSNTFGDDCQSNTFGKGFYSNTFGDYCSPNAFGDDCQSNTFGDYCSDNTFGRGCYFNTFDDNCSSNAFAVNCQSNTFGDYCSSNTFGDYCSSNTFGKGCYFNTFGDYCSSNAFGNNCQFNTFGDYCSDNTFGDDCQSNTFGNNCNSNAFGHNCGYNTFGKNCMYVDLAAGESSMNTRQYYYVLDGVQGTRSSHISITGTSGNNFETYVGMNSSGVLKTWVPADAVQ